MDRGSGIIEGVSVITEGEAKGHGLQIDATTLQQVKACADQFSDGVQVKIDHGTGFDSIVGVLKNFRIEGKKLLADLHLLKSHELRERVLEISETMPGSIGLSVAFSGANEKSGSKVFARCEELYSVDFVDRPAANPSGLFHRGVDSPAKGMAETVAPEKGILEQIANLIGMSAKPTPPAPVNFEAKATELETQLSARVKELSEATAKITELTAALEKAKTEFAEKETALAEKEKAIDEKVEKLASAKALSIAQSQGIAPIPQTPAANPAAPAAKTELKGLDRVIAAFKAQTEAKNLTK